METQVPAATERDGQCLAFLSLLTYACNAGAPLSVNSDLVPEWGKLKIGRILGRLWCAERSCEQALCQEFLHVNSSALPPRSHWLFRTLILGIWWTAGSPAHGPGTTDDRGGLTTCQDPPNFFESL